MWLSSWAWPQLPAVCERVRLLVVFEWYHSGQFTGPHHLISFINTPLSGVGVCRKGDNRDHTSKIPIEWLILKNRLCAFQPSFGQCKYQWRWTCRDRASLLVHRHQHPEASEGSPCEQASFMAPGDRFVLCHCELKVHFFWQALIHMPDSSVKM